MGETEEDMNYHLKLLAKHWKKQAKTFSELSAISERRADVIWDQERIAREQ